MKEFIINNKKKLILWASVSVAAVLLCTFALWLYFTPYMYVSLDVNPSIEYSVNSLDRVLSATAVNDDGSEILDGLDLTNKSINDAVQETVEKISDNGYFDGDTPGGIEITTSTASGTSTEKADQLAEELQNDAQKVTEDEGKTVEVESESVAPERVQQAKELGISPGKLNLIQKLQAIAADPSSITVEDWMNKPVKDIMKTIKDNKKADKAAEQNKEKNQEKNHAQDNASTTSTDAAIGSNDSTAAGSDIKSDPRNSNATKNSPNSNANSNATKNKKYSTAAQTTDAEESSDISNQNTSALTVESKEQAQQTQGNSANGKSNGSSNGKGK